MPPLLAVTPAVAQASLDHVGQLRADGIGEADVRHQSFAEERGDAAARAIHELIGDHEIQRLVLFLQRADRAQTK